SQGAQSVQALEEIFSKLAHPYLLQKAITDGIHKLNQNQVDLLKVKEFQQFASQQETMEAIQFKLNQLLLEQQQIQEENEWDD
ncbi:MAG: hypothetical protein K1Y36_30295, partial [Blastocatellia bacterium]|nr:hypothetical protein [Blastocatellia bacterium]